MINLYRDFWELLKANDFDENNIVELIAKTEAKLFNPIQGDYPRWLAAYKNLKSLSPTVLNTSTNTDAIMCDADIDDMQRQQIRNSFQQLIPWRKGPFDIFGCNIDSEWQSFMKWNRIQPNLPILKHKRILDVGCGNGYYMFKMFHQKPSLILGVDPGLLQLMQFWSIEKYMNSGAAVLPLTLQDMPNNLDYFDVAFSMGVLYHRKSPIHHIKELANSIRVKGHLVLETLVVDGDENTCLIPAGRYAQMRNVWFLPSVAMLRIMLKRCGFDDMQCIDETETSINEQRTTDWMRFHSLEQFLNQQQDKTVEGHPVPKRATIVAQKK